MRKPNVLQLQWRSGSRVVSQYNRRNSGGSGGALIPPSTSSQARFKPVTLTSTAWTAVTTGYPDAAALNNQTFYRADVAHNLGNTHAVPIALQDATGLDVSARLQFKTNEDPANPGNLHPNSVRIWISMDAAPAADMYVVVIG